MELSGSVEVWLSEDLSQIVEGYAELIKLMVWKPIYEGLLQKYIASSFSTFAEDGNLRILVRGRFIQNCMFAL